MRERIVIGNWKMNPPTIADAVELARNVAERMPGGVYVGVAPAAVALPAVADALRDANVDGSIAIPDRIRHEVRHDLADPVRIPRSTHVFPELHSETSGRVRGAQFLYRRIHDVAQARLGSRGNGDSVTQTHPREV